MSAAHAADAPFALGGVYGYGDHTSIYGVQAVWTPPKENELLAPHDLGLRLTLQVASWVASADDAQYHSLTDGSVMAELRYWLGLGRRRCGLSSKPASACTSFPTCTLQNRT